MNTYKVLFPLARHGNPRPGEDYTKTLLGPFVVEGCLEVHGGCNPFMATIDP